MNPPILVASNTPHALRLASRVIRTLPEGPISQETYEAFRDLLMDTADTIDTLAEEMELSL